MAPPSEKTPTESDSGDGPTRARDQLAAIEARWQAEWDAAKVYEAEPEEGRPKFFGTYPYSYMNAFAHVGHAYTMMRVELKARHERAQGKKVLFPMGFHVTGTPIVAAADRVAKEDPLQLRILKESGIPPEEIPKFSDPHHWVRFFPDEWKKDLTKLGLGIDWRRSFITTDLNPYYDSFIRWQFERLKEGGYVRKGKHPVIWDPVQKAVIGDHDRSEGEGVGPQEAVLLKFPIEGEDARFLIAATLRPETVFGQTNLWVDPRVSYQELVVRPKHSERTERWIVSVECADKLKLQDVGVDEDEPYDHVSGSDLIGKWVRAPGLGRRIPVLPASFMKTDKWTGIVTSVPSDAPLDFMALKDLKNDPSPIEKAGGDPAILTDVVPVPIIDTEGLGQLPAQKAVEKLGVKSQDDEVKLKQATEEVYQAAFYKGKMLATCKVDGRDFGGLDVAEAKDAVKEWLLESGEAERMWEPEGRVVSRHGHEAVVKVVSDQWFVAYGDPEWKAKAHDAFDTMDIYPEIARKQFHIVVDWLRDWACTRESGLGTRLPWDERWLIESLSDSTIYMAYYTISHHIARLQPEASALTPAFWDFVMLGKGDAAAVAKGGLTADDVSAMRAEFLYWYPLDYRNSGKDLLQNHLSFAVFNHTAIFPREHWMRGIAVNGWVTVDGEKMSKSKGNFITLRDALEQFGVSETRLAVANAGEGLDDANFEIDFAKSATRRLIGWLETNKRLWDEAHGHDPPATPRGADRWMQSILNRTVRDVDRHMARAEFRTGLRVAFFDLQRHWAWYLKRTNNEADPALVRRYVDTATRLMTVYVPHLAEELWAHMGRDGFAIDATFPEVDEAAIDPAAEQAEEYLAGVMDDVRSIVKMIGSTPQRLWLYTAPEWKRTADREIARYLQELPPGQKPNQGVVIKTLMDDPLFRDLGKVVPQYVGNALKTGPRFVAEHGHREGLDEAAILRDAADFLATEFDAEVRVQPADAEDLEDPGNKAKAAAPGRPAVYLE